MVSTVTPKYLTREQIQSLLKTSKAWNLEALRFLIEEDKVAEDHEKFQALYQLYLSHKKHGDLQADLLRILNKIISDWKINKTLVDVAHERLSKYKSSFDDVDANTDKLRGEASNPHVKTTMNAFDAMVAQSEKIMNEKYEKQVQSYFDKFK